MSPSFPELWIITDPDAPGGLVESIDRALEHVAPHRVAVQLRAKAAPTRTLIEWGHALRSLTRRAHARFVVNGRVDIAHVCEADGVHLPERGLPIPEARSLLGPGAWIGRSCHDRMGLDRAQAAGANYVTLSPIYDVPEKGAPMGLEVFREWAQSSTLPVVALGGIDPSHVHALRQAGAAGVAAIRAVIHNPRPADAVAQFLSAWDSESLVTNQP